MSAAATPQCWAHVRRVALSSSEPASAAAEVVAAAVAGMSNAFLVQTRDPLTAKYGCKSVAEHHHAHITLELLRRPDCNFFGNLPAQVRPGGRVQRTNSSTVHA
eukprot:scaffold1117_cov379-Prasinococcus_capsulatus_cf.AAC.11